MRGDTRAARRASVELQLDLVAREPRRPGRERHFGRRARRRAGANVEAALVMRALDLVPFEEAVAQARIAVRAAVGGRVGEVRQRPA